MTTELSTAPHLITDYADRDEWLVARATFIGASESAAILGCGYAGQNALTVYASKVTPGGDKIEATEAMIVGSLIEPGLCRVFEHFAQRPAWQEKPFRVRRLARHAFIGATLDVLTTDTGFPEEIPVELKNVDRQLMAQWNEENVAPLKFQVQSSHQQLVTSATKSYLMGLIGGNKPVIREFPRNDKFIGVLEKQLCEFWGFVERRELPKDFIEWQHDGTSTALARLFPDDSGEVIDLPAEAADWAKQLEDAKAVIKESEAFKVEAENKIKAAIAGASFGRLPCGQMYSWKYQTVAEHVVAEFKRRPLTKCKGKK